MTADDIRQIILSNHVGVKELCLTSHQVYVLSLIKLGHNTTRALTKKLGASVQSVSATLDRIYKKGYLNRVEAVQESGGIEWIYSSRF